MSIVGVGQYLLPLALAAGFTAVLVPVTIVLGRRLGVVDKPGGRHVHDQPVPRLGGLAIYVGFMLALLLMPGLDGQRTAFFFTGSAAFLLGLIDDIVCLKPPIKLAGQIAVASFLPFFGISVHYLSNPFGGMIDLGWLAGPAAVVWVVALMNMINLIDGLDGLAAGITAIAAASLLFLPQCVERPLVAVLCMLAIGAAIGFLPYNFHPARTFMGDGGAHFLGFVLGFITVTGALKGRAALTLSVPLLALAVPFLDTASAVFRRMLLHKPIFMADHGHLHHRLLFLGFNQRQTVLLLYLWSTLFGVGSVFLARLAARSGTMMLLGLVVCAALGLSQLERAAPQSGSPIVKPPTGSSR